MGMCHLPECDTSVKGTEHLDEASLRYTPLFFVQYWPGGRVKLHKIRDQMAMVTRGDLISVVVYCKSVCE